MAKEKIIYRFRYEEPYYKRRKVPFLDRTMRLVKEVHYGNNIRSYKSFKQGFTVAERLMIECEMGEFPKRVKGDDPDILEQGIEQFIERLKSSKES